MKENLSTSTCHGKVVMLFSDPFMLCRDQLIQLTGTGNKSQGLRSGIVTIAGESNPRIVP